MKESNHLPRLLIIDDLFGRTHPDRRNEERLRLCGSYLLVDVTGDESGENPVQINEPVAEVVFHRGQKPGCATVGDTVENDLNGVMRVIREGWLKPSYPRWSMILLDLCFYTGKVTHQSHQETAGMPEKQPGDDDPNQYFGLQILESIQNEFPDLPVVILSSKSREEVSKEFASKGAFAFLPRGDDSSPELLKEYIWRHGLILDETKLIIGQSKPVLLMLRAARRAAVTRRNILLRGERGSGKELLARYIYHQSGSKGEIVTVNSAVFTPDLFASELFGIEAKTATGVDARRGLIEAANGGTLFLDEIKDTPSQVQAAILRVIEEKTNLRVGARQPSPVDVRFLSATNVDIEALAATESFRSDLLDRLRSGGTVYVPPLRERKEDIYLLVDKFVRDAEAGYSKAMRRQVDPDAIAKLMTYDWPGNVRELRDCIYKAVNDYPDVEHLVPRHIQIHQLHHHSQISQQVSKASGANSFEPSQEAAGSIDDLINLLNKFNFSPDESSEIAGRYDELKQAFSGLMARYLGAALEATKKPTPDNPSGEILISPAVKLMTGDGGLKTSRAADIVKQILRHYPESELSSILKSAYEYASALRPRSSKAKGNSINEEAEDL